MASAHVRRSALSRVRREQAERAGEVGLFPGTHHRRHERIESIRAWRNMEKVSLHPRRRPRLRGLFPGKSRRGLRFLGKWGWVICPWTGPAIPSRAAKPRESGSPLSLAQIFAASATFSMSLPSVCIPPITESFWRAWKNCGTRETRLLSSSTIRRP